MKAKPSQRLQTVLKLAQLKEKAAAEALAHQLRELQAHQQQEQQLDQYKIEYRQQFTGQSGLTTTASSLNNRQRFYQNLDQASETQQQRRNLVEQQCEQARQQWRDQYSRQQNMDKLIARLKREESKQLDDKLQREQDDRYNSNGKDRL